MMLDDEVLVHAAAVLTRCEGGEIMAFLREHRGVDRQGLVIGISQGVGHLHSKGVVHGNLSPRKIFVDCTYDIPIAKIGGFELCYSLRENPVYSGVEYGVLRLVRYAPPELLIRAGVECDTSGDVWSFACTSLEVLQERPPYITVQNDLQIPIAAVMHTSPYGWEDLDDFQRVLMDCLDYEPSRRPTVSRIADRLRCVDCRSPREKLMLRRLVMAGKHTLPIRLSIEHEIMQEDDRNLTGKIQSEKLHTHQGHPPFPYKGTHKGRPVCIQQSDYFNVTDSRVLAESIRVLKRQIRIWRQLMHPNIERLRGWMLSPESEVISLGLISAWHPHRDVMVYLRQHPVSNRRKMVYDIALGLCYLHSREIVHANIEPGNVVIGDGGNACLRGFQFSYDRLDKLLPSDYHPPSPRFGSPELLNGLTKVPDRENDVWAFGCVSVQVVLIVFFFPGKDVYPLPQILIGEPPYSHLTDNQIPVAAIPPYEWEGLDEFESSVARCFTYLPHRGRISINGVRDTLDRRNL
ncbi:kinase-like domain-containing protein [Cantharellus anzutake]|uniref:kinase-like domain-containing protein n=1 Tax=Cantharellus anzutake TaxID=1750568 RepID=UPI001908BDEF|nr:kinase-like domain-containing protein [Cantharellus anzutake]KAF8329991.1 kinase-like domain-containing protein [Cantharellus anzutake]